MALQILDEKYKDHLENAFLYLKNGEKNINYFNENMEYFGRIPLSRYHTFKYCFGEFEKNNMEYCGLTITDSII